MSEHGNRGKGRPKGSKNKSLAIRTEAIRNAVTVDECQSLARELYRMAFDQEISPADRIKAQTLLLKYVAYTADVELITDSESKAPSADALVKAALLLDTLKGS